MLLSRPERCVRRLSICHEMGRISVLVCPRKEDLCTSLLHPRVYRLQTTSMAAVNSPVAAAGYFLEGRLRSWVSCLLIDIVPLQRRADGR
jgi:hypothetical protein